MTTEPRTQRLASSRRAGLHRRRAPRPRATTSSCRSPPTPREGPPRVHRGYRRRTAAGHRAPSPDRGSPHPTCRTTILVRRSERLPRSRASVPPDRVAADHGARNPRRRLSGVDDDARWCSNRWVPLAERSPPITEPSPEQVVEPPAPTLGDEGSGGDGALPFAVVLSDVFDSARGAPALRRSRLDLSASSRRADLGHGDDGRQGTTTGSGSGVSRMASPRHARCRSRIRQLDERR